MARGRGFGHQLAQMDRDAQARRDRDRKLEAARVDERPVDRGPRHPHAIGTNGRRQAFTRIDATLPLVLPFPPAPAPLTRLEIQADRIRRLEELDEELTGFLAKCAPDTWADARRALWRILRRARRELRAVERSLETAKTAS